MNIERYMGSVKILEESIGASYPNRFEAVFTDQEITVAAEASALEMYDYKMFYGVISPDENIDRTEGLFNTYTWDSLLSKLPKEHPLHEFNRRRGGH